MVTARTKARRRARRRAAVAATARSTAQMLVVLVGGVVGGGLLVLAAFPDTLGPVPPVGPVLAAAVVAGVTLVGARRLRPVATPQSGRGRR